MATLVPIYAKATQKQGYQMRSTQDMHDAMVYLAALNYNGSQNWGVLDGAMTPWLTVVSPVGTGSGTAYINDWIILEGAPGTPGGGIASVMRNSDFGVFFGLTPT